MKNPAFARRDKQAAIVVAPFVSFVSVAPAAAVNLFHSLGFGFDSRDEANRSKFASW
jgi:hypothetical protein